MVGLKFSLEEAGGVMAERSARAARDGCLPMGAVRLVDGVVSGLDATYLRRDRETYQAHMRLVVQKWAEQQIADGATQQQAFDGAAALFDTRMASYDYDYAAQQTAKKFRCLAGVEQETWAAMGLSYDKWFDPGALTALGLGLFEPLAAFVAALERTEGEWGFVSDWTYVPLGHVVLLRRKGDGLDGVALTDMVVDSVTSGAPVVTDSFYRFVLTNCRGSDRTVLSVHEDCACVQVSLDKSAAGLQDLAVMHTRTGLHFVLADTHASVDVYRFSDLVDSILKFPGYDEPGLCYVKAFPAWSRALVCRELGFFPVAGDVQLAASAVSRVCKWQAPAALLERRDGVLHVLTEGPFELPAGWSESESVGASPPAAQAARDALDSFMAQMELEQHGARSSKVAARPQRPPHVRFNSSVQHGDADPEWSESRGGAKDAQREAQLAGVLASTAVVGGSYLAAWSDAVQRRCPRPSVSGLASAGVSLYVPAARVQGGGVVEFYPVIGMQVAGWLLEKAEVKSGTYNFASAAAGVTARFEFSGTEVAWAMRASGGGSASFRMTIRRAERLAVFSECVVLKVGACTVYRWTAVTARPFDPGEHLMVGRWCKFDDRVPVLLAAPGGEGDDLRRSAPVNSQMGISVSRFSVRSARGTKRVRLPGFSSSGLVFVTFKARGAQSWFLSDGIELDNSGFVSSQKLRLVMPGDTSFARLKGEHACVRVKQIVDSKVFDKEYGGHGSSMLAVVSGSEDGFSSEGSYG